MADPLWVQGWRDFLRHQLDVFQRAVQSVSESFNHESLDRDALEAAAGSHPEEGMEVAAEYYLNMKAAYNGIRASFTASLYHMWEQQVRNFLFHEISRDEVINRQSFCVNLNEIKEKFLEYGVDTETLACWQKIQELNKITNSIKHGDGPSLEWIKRNCPDLVSNLEEFGVMGNMLIEEVIVIPEERLNEYFGALKSFWDELPDRCSPNS